MWNPFRRPPAPPAYGQGQVVPETRASPLSRLLISWLDPFLSVGFSRPLQADAPDVASDTDADFWSLPESRLTGHMTERVEEEFYKQCSPEERPAFLLDTGQPSSNDSRSGDVTRHSSRSSRKGGAEEKTAEAEDAAASKAQSEPSLLKALHSVYRRQFWTAGVLKLVSDTLNTTTPLVNQVLLSWLTSSFIYARASDEERAGLQKPQGIGYGIGLAFAIFAMQEISGLLATHYLMIAMTNGLCIRTSIIGAIFRKSLRLSGRARIQHDSGQIATMIAADSARLDANSLTIHNVWIAPIQIAIGIGLLIRNLGVSALVGLAVLIVGFPIQGMLASVMFKQRVKGVALTDQRARKTNEVLTGIRLIKYYAWESFYAHQVGMVREREVATMRPMAAAQAALIGFVSVVPVVGTVLSIITYALTGHSLDVAIIFSSVQFFDIIRMPLALLPIVLAQVMDALVGVRRVSTFLRAEELAVPYTIDPSSEVALDVDGDFTWEEVRKADASTADTDSKSKTENDGQGKNEGTEPTLPTTASPEDNVNEKAQEDKPFELKDLKLKVPKGAFVAIVGRVGSGKSSVLQALIGEMRKLRGDCVFSSTAAYVPQAPWIMNATLRQNIIFGLDEDEEKFRQVIKACCLEPDLAMLPNGVETEIGEKGINLSGGQKARVSLARAAYSGAEIVLMDDALSAVDSYVGKRLLDGCLLHGPLADKTRVLVTHALHVLDKTDYIYVMDEGAIVEQGTYTELMQNGQMFSRLIEEYGSQGKQEELAAVADDPQKLDAKEDIKDVVPEAAQDEGAQKLMQEEERLTGSVSWSTYVKYFGFAGGFVGFVILVLSVVLYQSSQVATTLFLGFWTSSTIPGFSQGEYMGTYAALGVGSGLFACAVSLTVSLLSIKAGLRMFKAALNAVIRSPVSFFDTNPLGRIMSRLSKDQDTLDGEMSIIASNLLLVASSVFGTAGLVFYTFPYLGIMFAPMIVFYYAVSLYYRRNSVEMKRVDSLLRSNLFASYTETLTGLSTVRAYRSQRRFVAKSEEGLDQENRAYYMTIAVQAWLGVRLDLIGNALILGIGLFAAGFRQSVDPSKIGVVMTYALSITQTFSTLVTTYAHNEQNFNAVERILHYTELPSEGAATTPNDPPESWPESGAVEFKDVEMAYRPGLPSVLKGVSFEVKPGEKVGIAGRTGAGKSSILQALFRIVNVQKGTITIDGRNIADIGLDVLRGRLALVPQDSVLFSGTLRENLDPERTRTDAEIIDALRRAGLLPKDGPADPAVEAKFSLDSAVADEGSNFSAGEKQLLALCRALVRNSRIIVLDEATSNVDVQTDAKVQRTIQTEFASSTLLCIAHRLNTIVYYDRILVMDAGKVAEFDTPLNLFDKEDSIFRSLCNEANLSRNDIIKIRASVQGQASVPESSSASVA